LERFARKPFLSGSLALVGSSRKRGLRFDLRRTGLSSRAGARMDQFTVNLKGWKAIAALIVLAAVYGLTVYSRVQKLDENGSNALRAWLLKDYNGQGRSELLKRVQDYRAGLPVQPLPELHPMNIEFPALSAHGHANSLIVKVEITVDGGPPLDGRPTRYFRMMHNDDQGWWVSGETDSYWYYRVLLR